jgi:hypothetical protein
MNRRAVGPTVLAAVVVLVAFAGATARAQQDTPPPAPPASAQPSASPANSVAPAAPASSGDAPAASGAPASTPKSAVMGYAYSEHARPAAATAAPVHHARMVRHAGEALATFTGFEMLADGGSRLFVQLDKTVEVEQAKDVEVAPRAHGRKGKRAAAAATNRLVFTFKGAELEHFNDSHSLETMHFNTPILRARLEPAGRNLRLVVVLRADATPTLKSVPAKDNGSIVQIDFPQGTYLPPGDSLVSTPSDGTRQPVQGALPSHDSSGNQGQGGGPSP